MFAALFILSGGVASAGEPKKDTGAMACVNDKWDVKEPEKGHKLVDAAMRCVLIPDDLAEPTISQDCAGNYEYMPDGSWKGTGTCTDNYPEGKISLTWEEGSQPQGVHVHQNQRHRKIPGRQGWRYVHVPESFRHTLRWPIQRHDRVALESR